MVALDHRSRAVGAAALDDVRVQRALHEVLGIGETAGVLLEDPHEQLADRLALGFWFRHAGQPLEEPVAGIDVDQFDALVSAEGLDDLVALATTHEPGVDVDARQLVADRLVDQRRGDCRIDAAAQPADGPGVADLGANRSDLGVDDRSHRPCRGTTGEIVQEALQHDHAVGRMHDLGMELDSPDLAGGTFQGRDRRVRCRGRGDEPVGSLGDGVEVAHPHVVRRRKVVQQVRRSVRDLQLCPAVFAAQATSDLATELEGDQLCSVADAEDRNPEVIDGGVERRRTVDVHALRATRQDQRRRRIGNDLGRGDSMRHDLAVDVELADPPGDQLRVLRSEVDYQHRFVALHHCSLMVGGGCPRQAHPCLILGG